MNYEQACSEMNFILNNLNLDDLEKIPKSFIQFFANNMDTEYPVNIDINKPLYEQDLLEETKAFIKIIQINYFTPEENRAKIISELGLDDINNNDNYADLFQNSTTMVDNTTTDANIYQSTTALIEYKKENAFIKFIKNLMNKVFKKN